MRVAHRFHNRPWTGTATIAHRGLALEAALPHLRAGHPIARHRHPEACLFPERAPYAETAPLIEGFPLYPYGTVSREDLLANDWIVWVVTFPHETPEAG